jgi:hypothetical protein
MSAPGDGKPPLFSMEELSRPFAASLGMWSAWAEALSSLLVKRGAPAAETVFKQLAAFEPLAPQKSAPLPSEMLEELRVVLGLPVFADVPALDPAALPSAAPMMELAAVAQQYLIAIAAMWPRLIQRFQAELEELRRKGTALDSAGREMDLWNNVVDRTLMEFNRSMDFAALQQRFLHAVMQQRRELRKMTEQAAKALELPTRSEMDDIYRRLHDLTREVDGLRRELRALRKDREQPAREAEGRR